MKHLLLSFVFLLMLPLAVLSQDMPTVTVVLKSGTIITGKIKQFDPSSQIVLNVGGFDTTINMSEVSSVTNNTDNATAKNNVSTNTEPEKESIKGLPEDTIVNICGVDVKFILMKGDAFKYGYDGRGSMSMKSEPVHDVVISPFYVSEEFVTRKLYDAVYNEYSSAGISTSSSQKVRRGDDLYLSESYQNTPDRGKSANLKTSGLVKYPENFSIHYSNKSKSEDDLNRIAFFRSDELGGVTKNIPSAEAFLKSLNLSQGMSLNVPTEVQWFYYAGKKYKETSMLKTPLGIMCEFATQVSMSDKYDPVGYSIVVKGSTKHDDADEIVLYRLYDRAKTKLTNITKKSFTTLNYIVNNKFDKSGGGEALCPLRLVMKIEQ